MLDGLTLDQMRMFVAVADAGSFRGAALTLSRAQSAVSHAIASLEAQLAVRLFDRTARRPTLTRQGRELLAEARGVLMKVDAMRARARGMAEGLESRLSVGVDPQFPFPVAAAALRAVQADYPSIPVHTRTTPLGAGVAALHEGECEIAITGAELADSAIECEALCWLGRAAVAAPTHPLARRSQCGDLLTRSEIGDHIQIVVPDPTALTEGRTFGVLSPGNWQASDMEMKRALILAGAGWGSLPLWLIWSDLEAGRLVRLPVAEFGRQGETWVLVHLAHRADQPLGPAGLRFQEALRSALPYPGAELTRKSQGT